MANSRLSRIEEKRTKKQLFFVLGGIVLVIFISFTIGIPLLVRVSALIGTIKSNQPSTDSNDNTAPYAPTLNPIADYTNNEILKLEGFAEPETTLKIFLNETELKKVLVGNDGSFSFPDLQLEIGENNIHATATDKAGNESSSSKILHITYKKGAPQLEISEPQEGQGFGKNQETITIKGKTDKGVDLRINDRFVSISDDGSFSFSLKLNEGENTITFIARDQAGNETRSERKVNYTP